MFLLGLASAAGLLVLSLYAWRSDHFHFWPAERHHSWQYYTFWALFRVFVFSLGVLCVLDYGAESNGHLMAHQLVGWCLFAVGFGCALYLTNFLGWRTAYSIAPGRLRTDGLFALSRNPIYVVTILGMLGLGVAVASWRVAILLVLWALFYLLAPFLEEPWLERTYGEAYLEYKRHTPRFF